MRGAFGFELGAEMKCIFGCRNAVAVYILPKGCVCKHEIVQSLCAQHEHKCTPLGRMILVTRFYEEQQVSALFAAMLRAKIEADAP